MNCKALPVPVVIFVRPQAAGNIGALARVMSNFGVQELRLVGEEPADAGRDDEFSKMDWALACKGAHVLGGARRFGSLRDAMEGLHLSVGTSGKKDSFFEQGYARPLLPATEAFRELHQETSSAPEALRWALVLGPEDDGLSAEEASLCRQLIHVDTVDESPSINVAMTAGLMLYHWHLFNTGEIPPVKTLDGSAGGESPRVAGAGAFALGTEDRLATLDEKEDFLDYVVEALRPTQFFKTPDIAASQARLRRWVQQAPAPLTDLRILFEAVYQLKCRAQGHFEGRDFFKKRDRKSTTTV